VKVCCLCGSTRPGITIGWPYCPNEYFHEARARHRRRYHYRGKHRLGLNPQNCLAC
jgi:hypothetical protein